MTPDHISETAVFFVMDRMSVLVYQVYQILNSVSSASSGSPLHPPLTINLNNSILQVSSFLEL